MEPDLARCDSALLDLPDRVVTSLLSVTGLRSEHVMLVGARCRDILHSSLGHATDLPLTSDLDVGLMLNTGAEYDAVVSTLEAAGSSGIRFWLAGVPTDLMPFGDVEDPVGVVAPSGRGEPLSVWAFSEVFATSMRLTLPGGEAIRIPTVAGYAGLKLAAWLDRSDYREFKDARDLALCVHWYAESREVEDLLYGTPAGRAILERYETDLRLSAAHLLGADVGRTLGQLRVSELQARWSRPFDDLVAELTLGTAGRPWPAGPEQREEVIVALEAGWREASAQPGSARPGRLD